MAAGRRTRCFMDIDVGAGHVSRIIVELYNESCPKTCENFRALCTGELGLGKTSNKPLNYKGTILHRVIKGFMIQGGDISGSSGRGGESIYGGLFEDENLNLTHDKPHLLSMANRGPNANGSQFFITTAAAPHLDSRNVVFGEVISGENIIALIENVPVDRTSRPLTDIKIVKCGQLVLTTKSKVKKKKRTKGDESDSSSSSGSSDSSSDKDTPKRERKKKDKMYVDKSDELKEPKEEVHPLVSLTAINKEDIPPIPVNRLYRGDNSREDPARDAVKDRDKPRDRDRDRAKDRTYPRDTDGNRSRARVFVRGVTKSGRNIKGRGVFRYRTPSRSRSRSATPPHWKQAQSRTIKMAEFKQKTKEQLEFSEEIRRREQARNVRHSTIQHSKSQENAQRYNANSKDSIDKISENNDSQTCSSQQDIQKSLRDPLSDLEEGETRDEESVVKASPSHTPTAVDYNALDYEAPTEILETTTNGAANSDDLPDNFVRESWDSKRQSIPRLEENSDVARGSKKKHHSSKVKETLINSKKYLSPLAKEVVSKSKDSRGGKSHRPISSSSEKETRTHKSSSLEKETGAHKSSSREEKTRTHKSSSHEKETLSHKSSSHEKESRTRKSSSPEKESRTRKSSSREKETRTHKSSSREKESLTHKSSSREKESRTHKSSSHEKETRIHKHSDSKSDSNKKAGSLLTIPVEVLIDENEKREERKKAEEKKWIQMMERKHEEELRRKKALESERKMLQQKKREKLREIEKKKEKEEELRKVSRDTTKRSKRRAPSTSSSSSSSSGSSSKHGHSSKSQSRRTSVKQRRTHSPARRHRSRNRH